MKKLIFFICFFIQFYFVYCESSVEIINKAKELKPSILEEVLFNEFSNEYDFLVYKYTSMEEIKKINDVIKKKVEDLKNLFFNTFMKEIPVKNIKILSTEVTQELYKAVMEENPSKFVGEQLPVECVSWYDAIYFCNLLSEIFLLTPVYSVNGETDVTQWKYVPHKGKVLAGGEIEQNLNANGYRLPTVEEWQYAARGGEDFKYAGSNNIDEVAWYDRNSNDKTHEVGKKKANGYGLYDMSGNVDEWCWDSNRYDYRWRCGGSWYCDDNFSRVVYMRDNDAEYQNYGVGFRIVCSVE